ncbi:MAG: hypothetical protein N2712_07520 [Brevinematales bacterium]|nr:hypothetical protein [Brevinematales bacterium]
MRYTVLTSSKINLGLTVVGRLSNGYHEIESIFLPLGVYDKIICEFRLDDFGKEIEIYGNYASGLPRDNKNIVWKVVEFVESVISKKIGFNIKIYKNIPTGAGLGGGSGNGAGVLLALMRFLDGVISVEDKSFILSNIHSVGADIPFFLNLGGCVVQGVGEKVDYIEGLVDLFLKYNVVIVYPNLVVSTKEAYDYISRNKLYDPKRWAFGVAYGLVRGNIKLEDLKDMLKNTFELFIINKVIGEIKEEFYLMGALFALMSGSGSSVYGIFDREINVEDVKRNLLKKFSISNENVYVTRFVKEPVKFI